MIYCSLISLCKLPHNNCFVRFEAVEKIEEAFTGLKVIEIEGNNIRLSLKTYIPYLETVMRKQDIENIIEPLEMNHELIIETVDTTWELKNAEVRIFLKVLHFFILLLLLLTHLQKSSLIIFLIVCNSGFSAKASYVLIFTPC